MHLSNSSQTHSATANNVGAIRDRHLRILIVDDEDRFREAMRFNLSRKYGALVTDVDSGRDALNLIESGDAFDLIFIDLIMPGMSGTETYTALKKLDSACPLVMMSSYSDSDEWATAKQLAVKLLSKPILGQRLTEVLLDVTRR